MKQHSTLYSAIIKLPDATPHLRTNRKLNDDHRKGGNHRTRNEL